MDISINLNITDGTYLPDVLEFLTELPQLTTNQPGKTEVKIKPVKTVKPKAEPAKEEPVKIVEAVEVATKTTFDKVSDLLKVLLISHKPEIFQRLEAYEGTTIKDLSDEKLEDFYGFLETLKAGDDGE